MQCTINYLNTAEIFIDTAATSQTPTGRGSGKENTTFCLAKLPGKYLDLSILLANKKFRGRGNKEGALVAFRELEAAGIGRLIAKTSIRGAPAV